MTESTKKQDTLVLVDAPNLAFRMFFALEKTNMRASDGTPTWAIYGFFKALFDLLDKTKANGIIAAYDCKEPTFRHQEFEAYKANRPEEMPDDLQLQWPLIREGLQSLNMPIYELPGYEADDVIGTAAAKADKEGKKVLILTGDRDAFQLINENISVLVPSKGIIKEYKRDEVFEYWGIWPEQVIDFKALSGDSSDNIPGIRGIGDKTAAKLLTEYGDLDTILKNADNVQGKALKEKLKTGKKDALLSKRLATIVKDVPIKIDFQDTQLKLESFDEAVSFMQRFEFNSFIKKLQTILAPFNNGKPLEIKAPEKLLVGRAEQMKLGFTEESAKEKTPTPNIDFKTIDTEEKFQEILKILKDKNYICLDLETSSIDTYSCSIVGIAFAWFENEDDYLEYSEKITSCYIPTGHQDGKQLNLDEVCAALKPILEDKDKVKIAQNLKFEYKILKRHDIDLGKNTYDTMIASYVNNPFEKHGLKKQAERILQVKMTNIEELIGSGRNQISMIEVEIEKAAPYAAADAYYTLELAKHYKSELHKPLSTVLEEIDGPLVTVIADMELNGVRIDTEILTDLSTEISSKVRHLEEEIFKVAGQIFNINSSQQLGEILFEKLGLEHEGKITKTGKFSTDASTLEELSKKDDTGIITNILEYRQLTKLISTYTDALPQQINSKTKNIHCEFNQTVTTTGRLSSSNPNLQNIPIRSELGRKIRKAFVSRFTDGLLICADYSQIELRVLAHLSKDSVLTKAFKNNEDIHKRTAIEIFEVEEDKVTKEMRSLGKTLNFALIYQQGPVATARQLNISQKEAQNFIEKYFNTFKNVKPFFEALLDTATQEGYVETFYGRRRFFNNLNSPSNILRREAERAACNAPLQGTAADLMKLAMIDLDKKLKGLKSKLIIQVHDELVLDVHPSEEEKVEKLVIEAMEQGQPFNVPLVVNISKGKNWYECK